MILEPLFGGGCFGGRAPWAPLRVCTACFHRCFWADVVDWEGAVGCSFFGPGARLFARTHGRTFVGRICPQKCAHFPGLVRTCGVRGGVQKTCAQNLGADSWPLFPQTTRSRVPKIVSQKGYFKAPVEESPKPFPRLGLVTALGLHCAICGW